MKHSTDNERAHARCGSEIAAQDAYEPMSEAEALSQLTQRLLRQEQQLAQHVSRTLHDRLGQSLAAIRLYVDLLRSGAASPARDSLQRDIDHIDKMLDEAIVSLRQLLAELSPPLLSEGGLAVALDKEIRRRETSDVAIELLLEADEVARGARWPREVEYGAFMIAREAINHALAETHASKVCVLLAGDAGRLNLEILDDGREMAPAESIAYQPALAITTMRERAKGMAARLDVGAADDGGNRVTLHWDAIAT